MSQKLLDLAFKMSIKTDMTTKFSAKATAQAFTIISAFFLFPVSAVADAILEAEIVRKFASDNEGQIALGLNNFVKNMVDPICQYHTENADIALDAVREGMSLEQVKEADRAEGYTTFVAEFIERQADFDSDNLTAKVRARIVSAVDESCQNALRAFISNMK